ncbi:hypothetical protein RRG08_052626 [Elysia crispata]|uniref:Uncharacterized protein n=1 Tax=Elysia crispata TaxID=231223 RepID=A0AAE1AG51_9GAST|nr:hypothetical protein RRG08_052626 [Elysia crispata]
MVVQISGKLVLSPDLVAGMTMAREKPTYGTRTEPLERHISSSSPHTHVADSRKHGPIIMFISGSHHYFTILLSIAWRLRATRMVRCFLSHNQVTSDDAYFDFHTSQTAVSSCASVFRWQKDICKGFCMTKLCVAEGYLQGLLQTQVTASGLSGQEGERFRSPASRLHLVSVSRIR